MSVHSSSDIWLGVIQIAMKELEAGKVRDYFCLKGRSIFYEMWVLPYTCLEMTIQKYDCYQITLSHSLPARPCHPIFIHSHPTSDHYLIFICEKLSPTISGGIMLRYDHGPNLTSEKFYAKYADHVSPVGTKYVHPPSSLLIE